MHYYISNRVLLEAEYIAKTGATVRNTALKFGVGKSTIHKDMTKRLKELDLDLYYKVRDVLDFNLQERHIRGGNATKDKYKLNKSNKKSSSY